MKQICKDYYKFSRMPYWLGLMNQAFDKRAPWRSSVAQDSRIPTSILIRLSEESLWETKCHVARHQNTPDYILEILSKDPNHYVRSAVENRNT